MSTEEVVRVVVRCDSISMLTGCEVRKEYRNLQEARDDGWSLAKDHKEPFDTSDYCGHCWSYIGRRHNMKVPNE